MLNFTDLTGLFSIALALSALCALALARVKLSRRLQFVIVGTVFVLLLLPVGELPLAAYVRGMVGDPSISLLAVLGYAVARRAGYLAPMSATRHMGALLVLLLAAVTLYPLALGAAPYDTYRWGYGEAWFLGGLLVLALAGVVLRTPLVTVSISLAVLCWAVGWYESDNLWDYLIDPMLAVYGVFALFFAALSGWRGWRLW